VQKRQKTLPLIALMTLITLMTKWLNQYDQRSSV